MRSIFLLRMKQIRCPMDLMLTIIVIMDIQKDKRKLRMKEILFRLELMQIIMRHMVTLIKRK
jgi:hypothetical protein